MFEIIEATSRSILVHDADRGVLVHGVRVLGGGDSWTFGAWEPSGRILANAHTTIQRFEKVDPAIYFGRIGTRRDLPSELAELPALSTRRIEAVKGWYADQYAEAVGLIDQALGVISEAGISLPSRRISLLGTVDLAAAS